MSDKTRSVSLDENQVVIRNLCPHGFTFIISGTPYKDGHLKEQRVYFSKCYSPARVIFKYEDIGNPVVTGDNGGVGSIPLKRRTAIEVTNLPPPAEEDGIPVIYVVSHMVAVQAPRADVYSPGDVDRCAGIIYGTRSLICSLQE